MQQIALQRSLRLRGEFMGTAMMYKKEQFVWLDETGTDNRTYMRRYGYAVRGDTPRYHRSLNHGTRTSVITALYPTEAILQRNRVCCIEVITV